MQKILEKALHTASLSHEEIITLLSSQDAAPLFKAADSVRRQTLGDEIYLRALIEFSNFCRNNCCYCGIRRDNKKLNRYRLTPEQIIALGNQAAQQGFKTVVLQSGEDVWFDVKILTDIITELKKFDLAVTLSIGEKSREEYLAYRQAGADRYLLRIETTDQELYHRLDPGMSWHNRRRCLQDLKELGYEVGSGIMVGLPEQSLSSLADDILFFKELDVDMCGIGPFIPHPDTPLAACEGRAFELALKVMAITRLLLPDINIPATTAMETLRPQGRLIALQSGANVIMPNITNFECRKLYELYPNKAKTQDNGPDSLTTVLAEIKSIGRILGKGYGGHRRKKY